MPRTTLPFTTSPGARRVAALLVSLVCVTSAFLVAPLEVATAGATPDAILYAYPSGFDNTGSSGCHFTNNPSQRCSLTGALNAAGALPPETVGIYLEGTSFSGESGALYSFDDPGIPVTIEPDPALGAGTVSVFDARSLPGTSILTLSGSGSVTLENLAFDNGDAKSSGGAVRISSALTVDVNDCTFDNNQSVSNSNGGAIGVDNGGSAQLTVTNSTFVDNWAIGVGGAIGGFQNSGTTTISDSTFTGNVATYGGAIGEGAYGSGTLDVTDSTFDDNSATYGGAIDNGDIVGSANATIAYSTFVDNVASSNGAAIDNGDNSGTGNLVLLRTTVDNGDTSMPALAQGGGTFGVAGSLVVGSATSLCSSALSDAGYNLESDSSASCGFTLSSDAAPGSDPGLAALADNGGTTLSEQLSAASPAVSAIGSTPATVVSINSTNYVLCQNADLDQTGIARSTPSGCDMGAVDSTYQAAQSTPTVLAPSAAIPANTSFDLSATGGSGQKAYVFSTSTPGCLVSGATLSFTGTSLPTTCAVQVSNPANGPYLGSALSLAHSFTFEATPQTSALMLNSVPGPGGTSMQVTASGGSGSGAVSYQVVDGSASGCAVDASSGVVTSTSPGTCVVQVTKGASGDYLAQVSPLSVVTFVATPQLSALILTSTRGVFATPLTLTTSGGSGSGAVSYRVSDGSARGCALTSSAGELTSSSAGTCVVQVIKAASGDFEAQLSVLTRVRLSANTPVAPIVRLVRARDGHAIVSLTDSDLGGDPETAVQYSLDGGTWKSAIRLGHGHVEITGLHALSQVSLRLRVYTAAGHSAPSVPVHFVAR